jgi:hypothetical protein
MRDVCAGGAGLALSSFDWMGWYELGLDWIACFNTSPWETRAVFPTRTRYPDLDYLLATELSYLDTGLQVHTLL